MKKYNLVVAGGGFAGVAAAIAAARRGLSVLLLDKSNCLGGAASNCLVQPFMLFATIENGKRKELCGGIFKEIGDELKKDNKFQTRGNDTFFHDEYLKLLLNRMVIESGAELLFHANIIEAERIGNKITAVTVADKSQKHKIFADYFIDATGDANLAYMSDCSFRLGRMEDNLCQPMTLCFRLANVDVDKINRAEINKLYKEKKNAGEIKNPREDVLMFNTLVRGVVHFNTTRIVKLNPTDIFDVTRAEIESREQMYEIFNFLKDNFSCFKDAEIVSSAPEIGIRESRMIDGEYILTGEDLKKLTKFPDAIAIGNYDMDIHNPEGAGTSHYFFKDGEYYTIPYRCLVPKDMENMLVAGRCISVDHYAQSSIRIMPIVCCIGEAAGTAAAEAYESGSGVSEIDIEKLRSDLRNNGAYID